MLLESGRRQHQYEVESGVSRFSFYVLKRAMSNADGIDTVPANPYSVTGEYGPAATAVSHRVLKRKTVDDMLWGSTGKDARLLAKFCRLLGRMEEGDLGMVLFMAQKMTRRMAV